MQHVSEAEDRSDRSDNETYSVAAESTNLPSEEHGQLFPAVGLTLRPGFTNFQGTPSRLCTCRSFTCSGGLGRSDQAYISWRYVRDADLLVCVTIEGSAPTVSTIICRGGRSRRWWASSRYWTSLPLAADPIGRYQSVLQFSYPLSKMQPRCLRPPKTSFLQRNCSRTAFCDSLVMWHGLSCRHRLDAG